jgi:hypothetical protein
MNFDKRKLAEYLTVALFWVWLYAMLGGLVYVVGKLAFWTIEWWSL